MMQKIARARKGWPGPPTTRHKRLLRYFKLFRHNPMAFPRLAT